MIKSLALGAVGSMLMVAAPSAQTAPTKAQQPVKPAATAPQAPAAPVGPPRAFPGYTQPEIGAAACRVVSQTKAICTLPALTAGRYVVTATSTATATAAPAGQVSVQALQIDLGQRTCGRAERRASKDNPWTSGAQTVVAVCEFTVLTDRPIVIAATNGTANATPDPKGPTIKVERLPWDGILSSGFNAGAQK